MEIASAVAPSLIGGLLGSGGDRNSRTSTQQNTIDPRIAALIYGPDSVTSNAQDWYRNNRTGLNDQMITGMNNQWAQLGASKPGFDRMQSVGMGLMGQPIAGNPFSQGYQGGSNFNPGMPQGGGQPQGQPAQPPQGQPPAGAGGGGLLGGFNPAQFGGTGAGGPFSRAPAAAPAPAPAAAPVDNDMQMMLDDMLRQRRFDAANARPQMYDRG